MLLQYVGEANVRELRLSDLDLVPEGGEDQLFSWSRGGTLDVEDDVGEAVLAKTHRSEWQVWVKIARDYDPEEGTQPAESGFPTPGGDVERVDSPDQVDANDDQASDQNQP